MKDSLYFSEQHLAVREMVRAFARDEVAPVAKRLDDSQEFPWENVRKMGELGLLGIPWPEEL
ncbi:MAG TPA: acyl-CoA dehydrogenase family protein, partial [Gemmatimonadaceae bacterium]